MTTVGYEILRRDLVCQEPGRYLGWPSVAVRGNGELVVVFSGRRDEHICPFGVTELVRSQDQGRTWSEPELVNDTPLDDRDPGIIETPRGALLISWFTSVAFVEWAERLKDAPGYGPEMIAGWRERIEAVTPELKRAWLGSFVRRSENGGRSWGAPARVWGSAPHGPAALRDGRLLYVGRRYWEGPDALVVEESTDDGETWRVRGEVPVPENEPFARYHEPHVVETGDGELVALFRYEAPREEDWSMRQSRSVDGGRIWSVAENTGILGYPPHLLRLGNGWLLLTFGRRFVPYGQRAVLSRDGGRTWDVEHQMVVAPSPNADMGYPATVQLQDGTLYTVHYQMARPGEKTSILGTHWRLEGV